MSASDEQTPLLEARFDVLHGLRGIAALFVVLRHTRGQIGFDPVPGAYLMVDLFFILSGVVIAHSYDRRLREGMTFQEFTTTRLIRLYPLYLLSLAISVPMIGLQIVLGNNSLVTPASMLISILIAVLFLPTPSVISPVPTQTFPLNVPGWSLFFELVANFTYAMIYPLLQTRVLVIVVAAAFATLVAASFYYDTVDGGAPWASFLLGFPRVFFGFFLGCLIRRLWRPGVQYRPRWAILTLPALSILLVAVLHPSPFGTPGIIMGLAVTAFFWPAIIWISLHVELKGVARRIAHAFGEASYAAYILHIPLLMWATPAFTQATGWSFGSFPWKFAFAFTGAVAVVSLAANRLFDLPVRLWLRHKLIARPAHEGVTQF